MCDDQWVLMAMVVLDRTPMASAFCWWETDAGRVSALHVDLTHGGTVSPFGPAADSSIAITADTVTEFIAAMDDVGAVTDGDFTYGPLLFAVRQHRTRPDPYPPNRLLWPLFDHACRAVETA